ncbi:MAG: DUF4097 domain-containing protein [Clostridiales bacterium]|nr:DUF4097 domain-containing protein [Clostridiales bacterium]
MNHVIRAIIVGSVIIGIGVAVLLVALGLNDWSFSPHFTTEEFSSEEENTALEIKLDAGKLKVEYHDEENIQISYPVASGYLTTISESGGKLTLEGNKRRWYAFHWGVDFPETVVKIPKDKISEVTVNLNAGMVELPDGSFDKVTVKLNAGTCNVGSVTECKQFDVRLNAGALNVSGVISEKFSCHVNAGSAKIQKIESYESEIKLNAGTANLGFVGSAEDYNATVNVSAGSCNGLSDRTGGDKTITVKVNAGSVNVSFEG